MFTRDDARWFSETVSAFYSAQTTAEFTRLAIGAVHDRFRLVGSACEEVGMGASSYVLHGLRCEVPPPTEHAAYIHDNPFNISLLATKRVPPILHMRDQVSISEWSRTDHFNGIARPMGIGDVLELVGQTRATMFLVGLHRDTVFSRGECEIARLLQPHVAAVLQRVHPAAQCERTSTPLNISLSPALRPVLLTRAQREVFRAYFPRWREPGSLPSELRGWIAVSLRQLHNASPPKPLCAFAIQSVRGRLLVRCFPGGNGKPVQLWLVETPAAPDYFRLLTFGLTSRECEVLHWVAEGKRDAEIAAILGVAPKTVSKHLERVLAKLHVENRGAAVSAARDHLAHDR